MYSLVNVTNLENGTPLSHRLLWCAELVAEGLKNKEIAQIMGTTDHVVKNFLRVIYDKLGFSNRLELALWVVKRHHTLGLLKKTPPGRRKPQEYPRQSCSI